jgi:hypothetical protein
MPLIMHQKRAGQVFFWKYTKHAKFWIGEVVRYEIALQLLQWQIQGGDPLVL